MAGRRFDKADGLFRGVLGAVFIILGLLYIPWLVVPGVVVLVCLLFSCTRLRLRSGSSEKDHG